MDYLGFGGTEVDNVNWNDAGLVHDWRNHIGEHTKALWATFTHDQRKAIALDAWALASAEEWD